MPKNVCACGRPKAYRAARCQTCYLALKRDRADERAAKHRCQSCGEQLPVRSYRATICRRCYLAGAWTRETMAEAIRAQADEHGRAPSYREFPHSDRAVQLFGSWSAAVRAARLEPAPNGVWRTRDRGGAARVRTAA